MTRCLSFSAHGASVKPQLPMTTLVIPCQHDDVPSGSQKICASMWVWPSMKPDVTTWPSASITSRARSRIRPIVVMRPCRTPTSARYRSRPDPSITVPFLITRSYDMLRSPRDRGTAQFRLVLLFRIRGLASAEAPLRLVLPFERLASAEAPLRLVLPFERLASAEAPLRLVLPLSLGAVGDLDGLLLGV